jgi:DNA-binding HxlR family transcriptional regulator
MTAELLNSYAELNRACDVNESRELVRDLFTMTGDKWSMRVIKALSDGPLRFGRLMTEVDGISHRMLTRTVRSLERDGLVSRQTFAESPPRVEYSLTPLGETVIEPVMAFIQWTHAHQAEIEASRARFDG